MTLHTTPTYGIAYADTDTALGDIAAVTEQAAETIEAALIRGGVAPANAADVIAVSNRVTSLESSRTTDETRLTNLETRTTRSPQTLALSSSFAAYGIAPFTEGAGLTMFRDPQNSVRIVGLVKPAAAIGTTAGVAVLANPIPAGFRPPTAPGTNLPQTVMRFVDAGGGPGVAVVRHRLTITSAGVMNLEAASAIAAGNTPIQFDITYPIAN